MEKMKYLRKAWVQILIAIVVCALLGELIYSQTVGYGTVGRGRFGSGLLLEGEIDYKVNNLDIGGEAWEANFYNLSGIYIESSGVEYDLITTSKLTFKPVASGEYRPSFNLKKITDNSDFTTATFKDENRDVHLTCSEDQITGIMKNTTEDDGLDISYSIIITDDRTINATLSRVYFYLTGNAEDIRFEIFLGELYQMYTFPEVGDNIRLKGELNAFSNSGSVWSDGKYIQSRDFILSGDLELKILEVSDSYGVRNQFDFQWKLEIEGEADITEGYGFPFWSIGLMLSPIPAIFIIAFHQFKKTKEEKKEKNNNNNSI
jgi:hypothetical protein